MIATSLFALAGLLLSNAQAESGINTDTGGFDFRYDWVNSSTGMTVGHNTGFVFTTTPASSCRYGSYCRTGTFTSRDRGTGTVAFTVTGSGAGVGNKIQHMTLTYDSTGAIYTGSVRIQGTNLYSGTMSLTGNPNWSGTFTQTAPGAVLALSDLDFGVTSSGMALEEVDAWNEAQEELDAWDEGPEEAEVAAGCSTPGAAVTWISLVSEVLVRRR